MGLRWDKSHSALETERFNERQRRLEFRVSFDATRSTNNKEHRVGMCVGKFCECGNRDSQSLEWLNASSEKQHWLIAQTERVASTTAIAGREECVINPRRNDFDSRGVRAVEINQLRNFCSAIGQDRIGACDDFGFSLHANLWLFVARFRLHARKRVECRNKRQRKFMLQAVTNNSGQPVVGVNRVGAAVASEVPRDTFAKFIENLRQVFFCKIKRAGIDVHDSKAGFDIDELGLIFG
jgi:hypothetical protein